MIINNFVVSIQINKHKVKIYNHCTYTEIIVKKNYPSSIKKVFAFGKYKHDKHIIRRDKTNSPN